ncbi:membrane fusion protein (multidrug efflux system) [Elusimicrobium posterum]|uniref:efflux RND transporter periplasmic adaptor subunit n=1 Tax=Elusimicrobium posterum TaxID=3116653 RepID=UPI003C711BF6
MKKLLIILIAVILFGACKEAGKSAAKQPTPKAVSFVTLKKETFNLPQELSGRIKASLHADVRPQVNGIIKEMLFVEGEYVEKGRLLYKLEDSVYSAALGQAEANLKKAQASLSFLKTTNERYTALYKINAVSAQDMENARSAYLQAQADVLQQQALLKSAKINLEYTEIKAPISGYIGISKYTVGALVNANQADAIASIYSIDNVFVDMSRPAGEIRNIKSKTNDSVKVLLFFDDGKQYQHEGVLKLQEIAVSQSTGAVMLRASFPNPQKELLPGMYVKAVIDFNLLEDVIFADQRGVTWDNKGNATALIINAEDIVEKRILKTTQTFKDKWIVLEGLSEGEKLIVEGVGKVRAGAKVTPAELTEQR